MAGFGSNLNSSGPVIGYNPLSVGMKPGTSPYLGSISNTSKLASTSPFSAQQKPPTQNLGAQGILATGKGPGGAAYGQNLATYAGRSVPATAGRLAVQSFPDWTESVRAERGGGNAPSTGIPQTLLGQAQGGQPYSPTPPPAPPATSNVNQTASPQQQFSIEQLFATPQGGLQY